jgi:hypothetical protein
MAISVCHLRWDKLEYSLQLKSKTIKPLTPPSPASGRGTQKNRSSTFIACAFNNRSRLTKYNECKSMKKGGL